MSKNKVSENIVDNIIEISYKLFVENGYEKSSIQDIIKELDLFKGAIYPKEEILYAVLNNG
ncbi:TetR/AcrR family transcriptional regulator [Terrisporobacter petrolearius]|uniref:TetR/AcrR family transcriptional regulator n=1 Tax=Terrisporobacter petrolearius TaxID=1460447 RepID=UPI001D1649EA|nr:TetR/AcrR family transcriptional regulator [Terrisporobacter petrolearius]MCC3865225.1 TetR/AcrR family transcriptional regulator [Terrisporobacter petrolearius]